MKMKWQNKDWFHLLLFKGTYIGGKGYDLHRVPTIKQALSLCVTGSEKGTQCLQGKARGWAQALRELIIMPYISVYTWAHITCVHAHIIHCTYEILEKSGVDVTNVRGYTHLRWGVTTRNLGAWRLGAAGQEPTSTSPETAPPRGCECCFTSTSLFLEGGDYCSAHTAPVPF